MKYYFPAQNQNFAYLQTNRSDDLGSIWSSFNLDFQTNLGALRLSNKLVINTSSVTQANLGLPVAFSFFYTKWWALCGTRIFKNDSPLATTVFVEDASPYEIGDSTTQFDVTNTAGTTFRYTYDGTGTDPLITALSFVIGQTVVISGGDFNAGNKGTFLITGSGANYFEVTNAAGVAENDKTISTGYITITGGSFPTSYSTTLSDMVVFNDVLWASGTLNLKYKILDVTGNPSTRWQDADTFGSASVMHKLVFFQKRNRLYYIDSASLIKSIDNNYSVASSGDYTLNPEKSVGFMTTMTSNSSYIWVGSLCENTTNNSTSSSSLSGTISQWDGISAQVSSEFVFPTGGILAMTVLDDIPYAIDIEGRILQYTGYSFKELTRLPIDRVLLLNVSSLLAERFVHPNGFIATKNNTLQILVNNLNEDANSTITENLQSGIWEYDLATNNFTHRYSPTLKTLSSSTVTDFGQNRVSAAGALKLNPFSSDSVLGRSTLLAGFNYFTDATTVKSGIFIDSPAKPDTDTEGQKRGYFITTWFNSTEVQDKFARLWDIHKRFLTSTDKIIYKYRLTEEDPIEATITWTSTTSFTTTTNVAAYGPTATGFNGTTGGEVEVLQGTGSGSCTHISSITLLAGTYTVTLDTVVPGVTGTAKARFQKWIKMYPDVTGQVKSYEQLSIGASNTQIQIKGVMEFTGDNEFQRFILTSNEDIKALL